MRWRTAIGLFVATAIGLRKASARLVTITEYPSSCKATYINGSPSNVHSTATSSPSPLNDGDANNGVPFILEVQPFPRGLLRRADEPPIFLEVHGRETANIHDAAQFMITDGELKSISGGSISAGEDTQYEHFAVSSMPKSIRHTFRIDQGVLSWNNPDFSDGAAKFYSIVLDGIVVVRFKGLIQPGWEPVILVARPAKEGSSSSSKSTVPYPTKNSTSTRQGNGSGHGYPTHTRPLTDHMSRSSSGGSLSHTPTASSNVSPNGRCGGDSGYTCIGSGFGDCCSRHGQCGTARTYCENGCQPLFGMCWSLSPTVEATGSAISTSSNSAGPSWPATIPVSGLSSTRSGSSSTSSPTSTHDVPGGLIGPNNPLSPDVSISTTWSTAESFSVSISVITAKSYAASQTVSTSSSTTSFSPCPTSTASLCESSENSATCSSFGGTPYNNTCGVEYEGPVIDTSNIVGLPPRQKRAVEYSLGDCQSLCNAYSSCVALNYYGTNCTILSEVTSTRQKPGAVGGFVPPEYVPAKKNPVNSASPQPTIESDVATTSSGALVEASNTQSMMPSSSSPQGTGSGPGPGVDSSSTQPAVVMSSSVIMPLSTISEIVTSSGFEVAAPSSEPPIQSSSTSVTLLTTISEILISAKNSGIAESTSSPKLTRSSSLIDSASSFSSAMLFSNSDTSTQDQSLSSSLSSSGNEDLAATSTAPFSTTSATSSNEVSSSATPSSEFSSSLAITSAYTPSEVAYSTTIPSSSLTNTQFPILPSPTPCDFGSNPPSDEDDSYCEIDLPFAMQIYAQRDRNSFASTNGYISIRYGGSQYSNQPFPAPNIPSNAVAPFFDDLYLVGDSTPQTGIYYQVISTGVTYEYYLHRGANGGTVDAGNTYHFTVDYDIAQPGVFTYTYYETGDDGDHGRYAAVGMQGINSTGNQQSFTYSFLSADITPGLVVRCDTQANTCVTVQR